MAIYYVRPDGSDSNSGVESDSATAWQTVSKFFNSALAGDICYIAPGTYREKPSSSRVGSSGSPIKVYGDIHANKFPDLNPGIVRITGAPNSSEACSTGTTLTLEDYWEIYDLLVDGTNNYNGQGVYGAGKTNGNKVVNCTVFGGYAIRGIQEVVNSCAFGYYGIYYCGTVKQCLATGYYGMYNTTNVYSSIAFGRYGFYAITNCHNCMGSGYYAIYNNVVGGTVKNFIALGGYYGIYGSSGKTYNSYAFGSYRAYGNHEVNDSLYGCNASPTYNVTTGAGYSAPNGGLVFSWLPDIKKIMNEFIPIVPAGLMDKGMSATPTTDILGLNLIQGSTSSAMPIGPLGVPDESLSYTLYKNTAPSIKLCDYGQRRLTFNVPAGQWIISAWVYAQPPGQLSVFPKFTVKDQFNHSVIAKASKACVDQWEQISASISLDQDSEVEVIPEGNYLYVNYYFSDFSIEAQ